MKKKIVRFAAFTLALAMLPGCGKGRTPAEPTTVNQAMLLEQSAKEQTEYTFPEKFTGDWVSQEGRLTIHADAQVVAELGTVLPTATVTPQEGGGYEYVNDVSIIGADGVTPTTANVRLICEPNGNCISMTVDGAFLF